MTQHNVHLIEVPVSASERSKADLQEVFADILLYNYVTGPTRFRTGDEPSVPYLVFTKVELQINAVNTGAPLVRSGHVTLLFCYISYVGYNC